MKLIKTATLLLAIFTLLLPLSAAGLELYSIIHENCRANTGLIINVDATTVYQLGIDGRLIKAPRQGINHILVYNTLDNPFAELDLSGELGELTREVQVTGDEDNRFVGWPIRFLENLIVFFDLQGNTHLVDIERIQKFSVPKLPQIQKTFIHHNKPYRFDLGRNLPECATKEPSSETTVFPTRMISDKIKISKFLSVYHKGFTRLNRFRKRTTFYARPYLYEKKTKIALVYLRDDFQEELPQGFPLYFQWPSGSNYGPQGLLLMGLAANELLPNVEPVFGLRFEGKYHFLTVSFAGNPMAFSFGSDMMITNRLYFSTFYEKWDPDDMLVLPQYNQIALTGFERGPYSISGGFFYPLIGIQSNGIFREILATQSMPMGSIQYTTTKTKFRVLASPIKYSTHDPSEKDIKLIKAEEMVLAGSISPASEALYAAMESFNLDSWFLRVNYDLDINRDINLGLSEVIFKGDYQETLSGTNHQLHFDQYITSVRVQQEFGDYVSLKAILNYFIREYQSTTNQHVKKTGEKKFSFAVAVEFIL